MKDQVYQEIKILCEKMCQAEPGRLRMAKNEEDKSLDFQPKAHEFLKLDGERIGRDFKLYGFMAEVQESTGAALADFAQVIMQIKHHVPGAFCCTKTIIKEWDRFFDADMRVGWRNLWEEVPE